MAGIFDTGIFDYRIFDTQPATVSLAASEAPDTATINATAAHTATLAATETPDTASINLTATHTAALAATETPDTAAIGLTAAHTADLAATENPDTASILAGDFVLASLAATEAGDTASINFTAAHTAQLAATETPDTAAVTILGELFADLAATEAPDTASIHVLGAQEETKGGGGSHWKGHDGPKYRRYEEYDDTPAPAAEKPRKRIKIDGNQIILAGDPVIQTGIVQVKPAWDALVDLQRARDEADIERKKRLRAIALADDDWLMSA